MVNSKNKTLLAFCFCFLFGVFIASLVELQPFVIYLFVGIIATTLWIVFFWRCQQVRFLCLCVLFFLLGSVRYIVAFPLSSFSHVFSYNNSTQEINGYVVSEPDVRINGVRYIVRVTSINDKAVYGRVYFKTRLYPRYEYGEKLTLSCHLKTPEPIETFRYDMYLARFGVFSICEFPTISSHDGREGFFLFRTIFFVKDHIAYQVNRLWHEPYASFMAGLLYGYRGGLGSLQELFSITGVTHIVAISGYNISLIAAICLQACSRVSFLRKHSFSIIIVSIFLFVVFAGASASVVRAGIMGVLTLIGKQYRREVPIMLVMLLTATIMAVHNPFILVWDAGFQLSFLATVGLIYLVPLIEPYFLSFSEKFTIRESITSTIGATIITLPLIMYQFGRVSIVSVVVNVLVLWIIPFIMGIGFLSTVLSFLFFPLAEVISYIAWFGLRYIVFVVEWFASVPFASIEIFVPWWIVPISYGALFLYMKKCMKV
jgi:competence protein ComEC